MSSRTPSVDPFVEQAIEWWVVLHSGEAGDADRQAMEAWARQDPRHLEAWRRVAQSMERRFAPVRAIATATPAPVEAMRRALLRPRGASRRAFIVKGSLSVAGVGAGALVLANRLVPVDGMTADLWTATGQRRSFDLPGGSTLLLNARSSADFNRNRQEVRLRDGGLIAEAGRGTQSPLVIRSDHGRIASIGAGSRFMVHRSPDCSLAVALHDRVLVEVSGDSRILQAGQGAWFDPRGIRAIEGDATSRAMWSQGILEVQDESLGNVVDALRSYRRGMIRISADAARLRVLGVYPLDDTDRALASLSETMPIRIRHIGSLLTLIDAR